MPPHTKLPDEVSTLLDERAAAREARDWDRADALRERLAELGWEVQDSAGRSTARPILTEIGPDTPDHLAEQATVPLSIVVVVEDHPDDVARLLRGLAAHPPSVAWEPVLVDNGGTVGPDALLDETPDLDLPPATIVRRAERLGWADARTLGMRAARGEVVLLLDPSIEPTGDVAGPLLAAFDDPAVGLAGGWGVRSTDLRHFDEAPPGEADAIEGYALAVRRDALRAVGGFDRRFRFYRNADLDFSFAVRDAGWRAVATEPLPAERHEHRGWSSLPEDERDRLSKRNFYRFLGRWRDRTDLLLGTGG